MAWPGGIAQDVRHVLRGLRRTPGFTLIAIATLAIGIGVNAAVFTVANTALFRGFPHVDPDNRVVYIDSRRNGSGGSVSYPDFRDWSARAKSFDGMGLVSNGGLRLVLSDGTSAPETADGTQLSANSFQVLRQQPVLGRDFESGDEAPGAAPVAMLSYSFWERRYGKDPSIAGKTIRLNSNPATIIGVMPPGFDFPHHRVDLWLPLISGPNFQRRQARTFWFAFARLADGVTLGSAQAEMDAIGLQLAGSYPQTNAGVRPKVMGFRDWFIGAGAASFYEALWGAVGFVLLIACANLANLLLARAAGRAREISVRLALGAGRLRIVRQLLVESVTLSSIGGALGWLIAMGGARAYQALAAPPSSYDHWTYALDYRVFFYLIAISIATGLLFGLAPAMGLARLDVNSALKDGGRGSAGERKRLSTALVIGEMALATLLLSGAGLMLRSFAKIYNAELGVKPENVLTAAVRLPATRYPNALSQTAYFKNLTSRLRGIPGVESIALASDLPGVFAPRTGYELENSSPQQEQDRLTSTWIVIGPNYFRTAGATLISGRDFEASDRASAAPVAIVNQRFANAHWPGQDAIGRHLRLTGDDEWRSVVGVASNIVQNDTTGQSFEPVIYVPFEQKTSGAMVEVARTRVPPESLIAVFRREIQSIDPEVIIGSGLGSISGPRPLNQTLAFNYWSNGVNAGLFAVFAAIALLLAGVGLYAVIAHLVSRRTQEIGIRMAVGATAGDIRKLILGQGLLPMGIGLAIGLCGSFALAQVLRSQLVSVDAADPIALAASAALLTVAAALGCWIPARRATRVDPVVALRHD